MDLKPAIVGSTLCSILNRQVWRRNETIVFGLPGEPDCCCGSEHLFRKV
jgi:hypothetical protein